MKGGKRGRGSENKTSVFGIAQRGGKVRAVVTKIRARKVVPIIQRTLVSGTKVMSDEFMMYRNLPKIGFEHKAVNHGRGEYVRGDVHTNNIEGFWSQLKRSIDGTYHAVSPKHLQSYVNEFSYRYNRRKDDAIFDALMARAGRRV